MRIVAVAASSLLVALLLAPGAGAQSTRPNPARVGEELAGTSWRAVSIDGRPVADPSEMTIDFLKSGDQVRGQAGCNRFVGPFASRGDKVTMGILRQSRADCPADQAQAQQAFIDLLHAAYRTEVDGRTLTFYSRQGQQITLEPLPK